MSRLSAMVARAIHQPISKAVWDVAKADVDYLVVAGADLASAATINITSQFHKVTGVVTIDNITDPLGAVAGQEVRLWFTGVLSIRNNGGGVGNIRTIAGGTRTTRANEIVTFTYDGAVWREGPGTSRREIDGSVTAAGVIAAGVGFVCARTGAGAYTITFDVAFATRPRVTVTPNDNSGIKPGVLTANNTGALFNVQTYPSSTGVLADCAFDFSAKEFAT